MYSVHCTECTTESVNFACIIISTAKMYYIQILESRTSITSKNDFDLLDALPYTIFGAMMDACLSLCACMSMSMYIGKYTHVQSTHSSFWLNVLYTHISANTPKMMLNRYQKLSRIHYFFCFGKWFWYGCWCCGCCCMSQTSM